MTDFDLYSLTLIIFFTTIGAPLAVGLAVYGVWTHIVNRRRRRLLESIGGPNFDVSRIYVVWYYIHQIAGGPGSWPVACAQDIVNGAAHFPPEDRRYEGVWRLIALVARGAVSADDARRIAARQYAPGLPLDAMSVYHGQPSSVTVSHRDGVHRVTVRYGGLGGDTYVFRDGMLEEWTVR